MATTFLATTDKHFEEITDPRVNRGRNYPLHELIFVTLCAMLCGANGWVDVERFAKAKLQWLRRFIPFANGVPPDGTLDRIFASLDSVEFYAAL